MGIIELLAALLGIEERKEEDIKELVLKASTALELKLSLLPIFGDNAAGNKFISDLLNKYGKQVPAEYWEDSGL